MNEQMQFHFNQSVVLVTGGTRGIGAAIAAEFLKSGATVIATYVRDEEKALRFKQSMIVEREKVTSSSESAAWIESHLILKRVDVRDEDQVKTLVESIATTFQKIDILVNNSGIRKDQILPLMSLQDWNDVLDTNLKGSFLMSKFVVTEMLKNKYGRIINISSVGGELGLSGQANYAASKAGQVAISQVLSKEVAKKGITVNNVLPGFIETELTETLSPELKKEYAFSVPMKRFGKPQEVAKTVLFLASKEAAYITGASIHIDGGL